MKTRRQKELIEQDVISSATPLEMQLAGVHPRCHISAKRLAEIRARQHKEPYAPILKSMSRTMEGLRGKEVLPENDPGKDVDKRGYEGWITEPACHYLITGDRTSLEFALKTMRAIAAYKDWGHSLVFGHFAHGMACGIDWLWDEIEEKDRNYFLDILEDRARMVFHKWSACESGEPFGYTWNIMGVVLAGLAAAACALYGERERISPLINLVTEKARGTAFALGDDGVSPEGMMYGHYFGTYICMSLDLIRDNVGVDLFKRCAWFKNLPDAIAHHLLPRQALKWDGRYFQFGDAHGDIVGGYCNLAWICARAYQDQQAQWLGNLLATLAPEAPVGNAMSMFWVDPDLPAAPPVARPTLKHFANMDIVIGRSSWRGDESAFGVKCGPAAGHKGVAFYNHPLAGGHMHPNNGVLQIFAHGEWVLPHPGYIWKRTAYHNCLLVNGKGQRGEESEWLEDLSYRQGAASPSLLEVVSKPWGDYVLAKVGPAYPDEAGIACYYRHVFYLKPDCWIVADAVRFCKPGLPEILFHTEFPLAESAPGSWSGKGKNMTAHIRSLLNAELVHKAEIQEILHSSRYKVMDLNLLRIAPLGPVKEFLFVTAVDALAGAAAPMAVACEWEKGSCALRCGSPAATIVFDPFLNKAG